MSAEGTSTLPAGKYLAGKYKIEEVIGEGVQSVVYRATREPGGDRVALKVIHRKLCSTMQIYRRFHREAAILRKLEGDQIVKIFDFVEDEGMLAIALEHVDGASLEALLRERGALPSEVAIEIALQVCAALGAAHARGIVHRDLKPANVLLERPPSGRVALASEVRVKVVDFGLGKVVRGDGEEMNELTEQGMIFGTPEYMAPEQARGDPADFRSDLYAAGVMLFEMSAGEVPFKGLSAIGAMSAHLNEPPPSPRAIGKGTSITPALEAVILRALAKDPAERFPTARAFAEALVVARDETPYIVGRSPIARAIEDDLGTGDTDLHLEMSRAPTLRAEALGDLARLPLPEVRIEERRAVVLTPGSVEIPADQVIISPGAASRDVDAVRDTVAPDVISDRPPASSTLAPPRSSSTTLMWIVVAIIAGIAGIAIGLIAGSR